MRQMFLKYSQIPFLKIFLYSSFLFLANKSYGYVFYRELLENHRIFKEQFIQNKKHSKNANFYREILFSFPTLSLPDLEESYVGYREIIKLLRNKSNPDRTVKAEAQEKLDGMLSKINSSLDQDSRELTRLFVAVCLYSTEEDLTVWNNAFYFLSRIQNRRIVFSEVEQELILILSFPQSDVQLRIAAAKTLGRLRPKNPHIPNQLIEALRRSWNDTAIISKDKSKAKHRYLLVIEIAKALIEINPKKLITALYYKEADKPDIVDFNALAFIPEDPKDEEIENLSQLLKRSLPMSGQSLSTPEVRLSYRESRIRKAVQYALKNIHSDNPEIYRPLLKDLFFNENLKVRKRAADILTHVNTQQIATNLHFALSHSDKRVRIAGIRAAKEIRLYLLSSWSYWLSNPDYPLSLLAERKDLQGIPDQNWQQDHKEVFFDILSHPNFRIRMAAFIIFFRRVISQELISGLSHPDPEIRNESFEALKKIYPEQLAEVLDQPDIRRGLNREAIFHCYNEFKPRSKIGVQLR